MEYVIVGDVGRVYNCDVCMVSVVRVGWLGLHYY